MKNLTHDKIAHVFSSEQTTALAAALDEMTSSREYVNAEVAKSALETTQHAISTARWSVGIFLSVCLAVFGLLIAVLFNVLALPAGG